MMSGDWNVVPCRGTAYEKAQAERCFGGFQDVKATVEAEEHGGAKSSPVDDNRVSLHPLKRNRKSWQNSKRRTFQLFWAVVYK